MAFDLASGAHASRNTFWDGEDEGGVKV